MAYAFGLTVNDIGYDLMHVKGRRAPGKLPIVWTPCTPGEGQRMHMMTLENKLVAPLLKLLGVCYDIFIVYRT